jgi:hypothetical protein
MIRGTLILMCSIPIFVTDECVNAENTHDFCNDAGVCQYNQEPCTDAYTAVEWSIQLPFREDGQLYAPVTIITPAGMDFEVSLPGEPLGIVTSGQIQGFQPRVHFIDTALFHHALDFLTHALLDMHPERPTYTREVEGVWIRDAIRTLRNILYTRNEADELVRVPVLLRSLIANSASVWDYMITLARITHSCGISDSYRHCYKALVPYQYLAARMLVEISIFNGLVRSVFSPTSLPFWTSAVQFHLDFMDDTLPSAWPLVILDPVTSSLEIPLFHTSPPDRLDTTVDVDRLIRELTTILSDHAPDERMIPLVTMILTGFEVSVNEEHRRQICENSPFLDWFVNRVHYRHIPSSERTRALVSFLRTCKGSLGGSSVRGRAGIIKILSIPTSLTHARPRHDIPCSIRAFDIIGTGMFVGYAANNLSDSCVDRIVGSVLNSEPFNQPRGTLRPDIHYQHLRALGRVIGLSVTYGDPGMHLHALMNRQPASNDPKATILFNSEYVTRGFCDVMPCSPFLLAFPTNEQVKAYLNWVNAARTRMQRPLVDPV